MEDNTKIEEEESKFVLDFVLEFVDLNSKTHVHKEFTNWTGQEFETIIEEIRCCLLSVGYNQSTVDKYIQSTL